MGENARSGRPLSCGPEPQRNAKGGDILRARRGPGKNSREGPMLLVHAGNRVDAPDRADPRFPLEHLHDVHLRIGRLLAALSPRGVVSSAAAGADLIVLEEAASRGIPIHVVLPLVAPEFEAA